MTTNKVELTAVLTLAAASLLLASVLFARAQLGTQTPVYGKDGSYQGSVFDYGKTQTYTDKDGRFSGSSINNKDGTTNFYGRDGHFQGSAGSSIDRAFNFKGRR